MGEVIQFPLHRASVRRCDLCIHAVAGAQTFCVLYREFIVSEAQTAEECGEFIRDEVKEA